MSTKYMPILGTLGYVLSPDGKETLLIHRNARLDDEHYGKYNGLGGKLESDEDIVTGIKREIREEAGIECEEVVFRGTINWPGFGANGEDWFGFVFRIDRFSGTPIKENPEGELSWVPVDKIDELPMWEGDRYFLPMVFDDSPPFHAVMRYDEGKPVSWSYTRAD
ncbi:MAG: 8-oxo-dGTP diphosphatase [Chloroflexota bacterium]